MAATLTLTADQVTTLLPMLQERTGGVLVAAIHPNGTDWQLDVRLLPPERRDAIRAARAGTLKVPKARKAKPVAPTIAERD